MYLRWWGAIGEVIRDGQLTGEFTSDIPAHDAAVAVLALMDGIAIPLLLRRDGANPDEARRIVFIAMLRLLAP